MQIRRSICTSESCRASIRVSPDFTVFTNRSPIFRVLNGVFGRRFLITTAVFASCWCWLLFHTEMRLMVQWDYTLSSIFYNKKSFHFPLRVYSSLSLKVRVSYHHYFYIQFELLGPCYKTGWLNSSISGTFFFVCFWRALEWIVFRPTITTYVWPALVRVWVWSFEILFPPWGSTQNFSDSQSRFFREQTKKKENE